MIYYVLEVKTAAESEVAQKLAFEIGYTWNFSQSNTISNTQSKVLFFNPINQTITHSKTYVECFKSQEYYKLKDLNDFVNQIIAQPYTSVDVHDNKGDKTDIYNIIFYNNVCNIGNLLLSKCDLLNIRNDITEQIKFVKSSYFIDTQDTIFNIAIQKILFKYGYKWQGLDVNEIINTSAKYFCLNEKRISWCNNLQDNYIQLYIDNIIPNITIPVMEYQGYIDIKEDEYILKIPIHENKIIIIPQNIFKYIIDKILS